MNDAQIIRKTSDVIKLCSEIEKLLSKNRKISQKVLGKLVEIKERLDAFEQIADNGTNVYDTYFKKSHSSIMDIINSKVTDIQIVETQLQSLVETCQKVNSLIQNAVSASSIELQLPVPNLKYYWDAQAVKEYMDSKKTEFDAHIITKFPTPQYIHSSVWNELVREQSKHHFSIAGSKGLLSKRQEQIIVQNKLFIIDKTEVPKEYREDLATQYRIACKRDRLLKSKKSIQDYRFADSGELQTIALGAYVHRLDTFGFVSADNDAVNLTVLVNLLLKKAVVQLFFYQTKQQQLRKVA